MEIEDEKRAIFSREDMERAIFLEDMERARGSSLGREIIGELKLQGRWKHGEEDVWCLYDGEEDSTDGDDDDSDGEEDVWWRQLNLFLRGAALRPIHGGQPTVARNTHTNTKQ